MQKTIQQSELVRVQLEMGKYCGQRKHVSQITQQENDGLYKRLKEVDKWKIVSHALDRLKEKNINATREDIVSTINNSTLIEYKIDYDKRINRYEERVVLRSNAIVNRNFNLNVVFSLTKQQVITVWINDINDFHKTLDWGIYNEDMKVFGV